MTPEDVSAAVAIIAALSAASTAVISAIRRSSHEQDRAIRRVLEDQAEELVDEPGPAAF